MSTEEKIRQDKKGNKYFVENTVSDDFPEKITFGVKHIKKPKEDIASRISKDIKKTQNVSG